MKFINNIKKYAKLFFEFLQYKDNHRIYKFKMFFFMMIFLMLFFLSVQIKRYFSNPKELFDEGVFLFSPEKIYYDVFNKNKLLTKPKTNYSVLLRSLGKPISNYYMGNTNNIPNSLLHGYVTDKRFTFEHKTGTNENQAYLIMHLKTNFERKVLVDKENKKYFVVDKNYKVKEYIEFKKREELKRVFFGLIFLIFFILVLAILFIEYLR